MADPPVDLGAMYLAAQAIEAKHQQIHALQAQLQWQMTIQAMTWSATEAPGIHHGYQQLDTELEKVKQSLETVQSSLAECLRFGSCGTAPSMGPK